MTQDQAENLRRLVESTYPTLPPHKARRIAFLSGKGGVGKTSLAVNIALALARMGHKTILIDCDLGLANAELLLGVQPDVTLDNLLTAEEDIKKALLVLPSGLWVLPGAGSTLPKQARDSGQLGKVLNRLDDMAEFVLMDGGAGIDEGVQYVAGLSDELLIVAAPESSSTLNAYRLIKILHEKHPHIPLRMVINRARNDYGANRTAERLNSAIRKFLGSDTEFVGWVPSDPIVEQAAMERRPFVEKYPGSMPSRAIVALANKLLIPPPGPPRAA